MANKLVDLDALESLARKISEKYATKDEVSNEVATKASSVYYPGGSRESLDSSLLAKENLGKVYNLTNEFQTNGSDFVDGDNKTYPAGTNVVIIDVGSETYKFDVLAGFVDLSNYVTNNGLETSIGTEIDKRIADSGEVDNMLNEVFQDE